MNFYSNFLLFVIILITIYLLYRLIVQRQKIYEMNNNLNIENFDMNNNYNDSVVKKLAISNKNKLTIHSFSFENLKDESEEVFQLKNYCIKSAYCSVFNGSDCTIDMLYYVLSRGCRFLDLELYYVNDNVLVGFSNDYLTPSTTNSLLLNDVFTAINENAFNYMSPNKNDPLFIQLRLKHIPKNLTPELLTIRLTTIYNQIAQSIQSKLTLRYSESSMDATVSIQKLQRHIVIIMDTSYNNRHFANLSPNLKKLVHLQSNTDDIVKNNVTDVENMKEQKLKINADGISTNAEYIQEIVPTITKNMYEYHMKDNMDALSMLVKYSANICPMQFWMNGPQLEAYENIFNKGGKGIIPISYALSYAEQQFAIPQIMFP